MNPATVDDKDFQKLIARRAQTLLTLAGYVSKTKSTDKILVRPLLGQLLSQSIQLEELLDAYDARNNCKWCSFRYLVAAMKLFADVSYELLHIQHSLPAYRLLPIAKDFVKATNQALAFTGSVLLRVSEQILLRAAELHLPLSLEMPNDETYAEQLPTGRLPRDCVTRKAETVSDTVALLATAFLNLAAESEHIHAAGRAKSKEFASYVSDSVSEENLRSLELRFHNLQSLYDTYVSGTEAEHMDTDLPVLRGHISVVFHLLKTATLFAHYYERHVSQQICDLPARQEPVVGADELLWILMNYSLRHVSQYIVCAERLCQTMLKRYVTAGQIEVPIPPYRGFHVRPSTLISKLVLHYGSEVQMELEGEIYDAGSPLELFRANEKINASKRRSLAEEIDRLGLVPEEKGDRNIPAIVHDVVLALVAGSKLVLYEQPLQLPEKPLQTEGMILEQVTEEVGRLLATGKIDINIDVHAKFLGDKRVLADIKLLAESGYGEDNFGNNIALPKELKYLRR